MAIFYSNPHTKYLNQPKSYWIPLRIIPNVLAYIRTVLVKAKMKMGNKWTGYDVTSERID